MVTFVLLVVLCGAVAAFAVVDSESRQRATDDAEQRRAAAFPRHDPADLDDGVDDARAATRPSVAVGAAAVDTAPTPALAARTAPRPVAEPRPRRPTERRTAAGPPRGRPGTAPRSRTAWEGRYRDVARVPWWRRLLAFVGLIVIVVGGAVASAAVIALLAAIVAELLNSSLGT